MLGFRAALFIALQFRWISSLIDPCIAPGAGSGLVSRYLLTWTLPLLWRGYRRPLSASDLGEIDPSLLSGTIWAAFEPVWLAKKDQNRPLLRACIYAFPRRLAAPLLPCLIYTVASMGRPLLISSTVNFVQSYSTPTPQPLADGWALVAAACLIYTVFALSTAVGHVAMQRSALSVRGALMEALYRKSLRIRVEDAVEMGAAKASNLMSVDVDNVVRSLTAIHTVWTALVLTALGLYIIYTQIGISFVSSQKATLI